METKIAEIFKSDPYANFLNITLCDYQAGYAKAKVTIAENMLNFNGFANGGLLFSLADYTFAVASNSHGRAAVGLNVNMSYLAPGELGDELICAATEIKRTPKIATYEMKIRNASGELIATMEGMVYIKKEQLA